MNLSFWRPSFVPSLLRCTAAPSAWCKTMPTDTPTFSESTPGTMGMRKRLWFGSCFPYHPWDWWVYLHLVDFYGKSIGKYTIHGCYGFDMMDLLLVKRHYTCKRRVMSYSTLMIYQKLLESQRFLRLLERRVTSKYSRIKKRW